MKTKLEKHKVCDTCWSVGITDSDCYCSYGKFNLIELEFEVCECCGNVVDDGQPADTEFNKKQLEDHGRDNKCNK